MNAANDRQQVRHEGQFDWFNALWLHITKPLLDLWQMSVTGNSVCFKAIANFGQQIVDFPLATGTTRSTDCIGVQSRGIHQVVYNQWYKSHQGSCRIAFKASDQVCIARCLPVYF